MTVLWYTVAVSLWLAQMAFVVEVDVQPLVVGVGFEYPVSVGVADGAVPTDGVILQTSVVVVEMGAVTVVAMWITSRAVSTVHIPCE